MFNPLQCLTFQVFLSHFLIIFLAKCAPIFYLVRRNQQLEVEPLDTVTSRRRFLIGGGALIATTLFVPKFVHAKSSVEKSLNLYNMHTGEWFKQAYCVDGQYLPDALKKLNHFLRDWRNDQVCTMDKRLLDLVHDLQKKMGCAKTFDIISGYRSPETNNMLHKKSNGVAKNSLHKRGLAVDIKMPGNLRNLRDLARSFKRGGVGYYPTSGFVHVDIREKPTYWGA